MTWTVYLLSVLDGVRSFLGGVAFSGGVVGLMACLPAVMGRVEDIDIARDLGDRLVKWGLVVALLCGILKAFTPSTDALIKSYVIVEGGKVVNAENVEAVTKALAKKLGIETVAK